MPKFILSRQFYLKLSDICADIAQVSLASLAVPFIIGEKDWAFAASGLIIALIFWIFSLLITLSGGKEK